MVELDTEGRCLDSDVVDFGWESWESLMMKGKRWQRIFGSRRGATLRIAVMLLRIAWLRFLVNTVDLAKDQFRMTIIPSVSSRRVIVRVELWYRDNELTLSSVLLARYMDSAYLMICV